MSMDSWGFETGSNGNALTEVLANADLVILAGGTATLSTTQKAHGAQAVRMTGTTTSGGVYISKNVASSALGAHVYVYLLALPSAETQVIYYGSGGSRAVALAITTAGTLRIRDAAAAGGTAVWTATTALSLNTWYRVSLFGDPGSTTSNGVVQAAGYLLDATSAVSGMSSGLLTGTTGVPINTGVSDFSVLRVGAKCAANTMTVDMYIDDYAFDPNAVGLLAPYGSAPPAGLLVGLDGFYPLNASGITSTPGPTTYSITPSSGVLTWAPGKYLVPQADTAETSYTVVAQDSVSGATASFSATVPPRFVDSGAETEQLIWDGTAWL